MPNLVKIFIATLLTTSISVIGQTPIDIFPVRGFAIAAPQPDEVDRFIRFINDDLAPRQINVLVLRVDYNYQFESYPTLRDSNALSSKDVQKLVSACSKQGIKIIPQINLLGHQSWASKISNLLKVYPQFDETPHVKMPEKYVWPNADNLYCKSYCPLHPDVHKVVFALMDEICDAFKADAFHAGMDEVFYIGDEKCPRCSGIDKAELFAGETRAIHDHLAQNKRELLIWGDRLLDGKSTGLGMWEASMNNTHRAIDLIPKDVVICDWHYERPDQTAVYFAMKGLRVITCPWRNPEVTALQVEDMARFRKHATKEMKGNYFGMMQTVWSGVTSFLDGYYGSNQPKPSSGISSDTGTPWESFKVMTDKIKAVNKP